MTNTLKKLLFYPIALLAFCALNSVYKDAPLSCGAFVALLYMGVNIPLLATTFTASYLVYGDVFYVIFGATFSLILGITFFFYRRYFKVPKAETVLFIFLGFLVFFIKDFPQNILEKLVYMSIIAIFTLISQSALYCLLHKKLSKNINAVQGFFTALFFIVLFIGTINLFGITFYKTIAIFIFIMLSRYYKDNSSLIVAVVLAAPLVIVTESFGYLTSFILFYALFCLIKEAHPIMIAVGFCGVEALCGLYLTLYNDYGINNALPCFTVIFLTSFIPKTFTDNLDKKYNFNTESALVRSAINRNRMDISKKLYDLSSVFFQMTNAFNSLNRYVESVDKIVDRMSDEVLFNMCSQCALRYKCEDNQSTKVALIKKIIASGINKGRITIVDLNKDFLHLCGYPNGIIFEVNRLIGAHFEHIRQIDGLDKTKEILSLNAEGIAKSLKSLAFFEAKTTSENKKDEIKIIKALAKKGINVEEALCFGEGSDTEIMLIVAAAYYYKTDFAKILSKTFNTKLAAKSVEKVSGDMVAVTMKIAPLYDAVFGVSKVTKEGSDASGDCHSMIKIDQSNFLVALSDGMGSGEDAHKTSETALDLIESLYKAGLDTEFILTLVNKLLLFLVDDNFSAMDLALVNLDGKESAFIKIGSPYGFILSEEGIRFIEGASLPLGILEELRPGVASTALKEGDVIVMISDGVSDAFTSSGDLADFLKAAPLHNPQDLADTIVKKALDLCDNHAEDDMTAVCVRIITADIA